MWVLPDCVCGAGSASGPQTSSPVVIASNVFSKASWVFLVVLPGNSDIEYSVLICVFFNCCILDLILVQLIVSSELVLPLSLWAVSFLLVSDIIFKIHFAYLVASLLH